MRFDIKERIRIREQQKELTKCSQEFTKNFIQDLPISGSGLHGWHGGAGGAAALHYTLRLLQVFQKNFLKIERKKTDWQADNAIHRAPVCSIYNIFKYFRQSNIGANMFNVVS